MKKIRIALAIILFPLSLIYGTIIFLRNKFYDFHIFPSQSFKIPLIAVGNITVGGTGKTPHIEYLAGLLKEEFNLATLSRGYKRKSKDFQMVSTDSTVKQVGDEPLQIKTKLPDISVAVDGNRVHGVQKLRKNVPDLDLVLLDDAYQHRKIKVNLSILLIDYNHPINKDFLLPLGNLREQVSEKRRANIIIITKSPPDLQPIQKRIILKRLKPYPYQSVFFTTLEYGKPQHVFRLHEDDGQQTSVNPEPDKDTTILLITGIANPKLLQNHISENISEDVHALRFPDHRYYSPPDIKKIKKKFNNIEGKKAIVTTEKDAMRFRESAHLDHELKQHLFYIPIKVKILNNRTSDFNKQILEYVRKNKKHSFLYPE